MIEFTEKQKELLRLIEFKVEENTRDLTVKTFWPYMVTYEMEGANTFYGTKEECEQLLKDMKEKIK